MFQSQQFSELEEDILECPMYPREDSEQQSEATFNAFQKGIKWLSELSETVTCPGGLEESLGLSFSTISGRALSAKGTFFPLLFRATF